MDKLVVLRSFILPQYKELLKSIPFNQTGEYVNVLEIPETQWNTFHNLSPGEEYGLDKINGTVFKKVNFDEINHQKSNKITVIYTVAKSIEDHMIVTIRLAFHGELPSNLSQLELDALGIPINWAVVSFDNQAKKLTRNKWS